MSEKCADLNFRDVLDASHSHTDSSSDVNMGVSMEMEKEDLETRSHLPEEKEGKYLERARY